MLVQVVVYENKINRLTFGMSLSRNSNLQRPSTENKKKITIIEKNMFQVVRHKYTASLFSETYIKIVYNAEF